MKQTSINLWKLSEEVRKCFICGLLRKRTFLFAFTLAEVIVALGLSSVLLGTIFYFLILSRDSLGIATAKVSLQQEMRRCLIKMAEEISESSINSLKDMNNQSLNIVQRNETLGKLECLPQDEECVYYSIKFKKPLTWDSSGKISSWSDYITYTLSSGQITRKEGQNQEILVNNINLVKKTTGNGYTYDPNSLGSGFERLTANRLKISLVAEREDTMGRKIKMEIGSIAYLRN